MLDDFHESTRSVGMVGILLGLLVVAGFCGLGMAVMSGSTEKGPSLLARLEDQKKNLDLTRENLESKKRQLAEIDRLRSGVAVLKEKSADHVVALEDLAKVKDEVTDAEGELDEVQLNFEEYRQKYRNNERTLAVGEILDLSETKGDAYQKSRVIAITPLHLRVMGSAGPDGIPYEELPHDIQDRFQFSREEAEAYQNKMDAVRENVNKRNAKWEKLQKTRKGVAARKGLVERIAQNKLAIAEKLKQSDRYDKASRDWVIKAQEYERKAAAAKRAGRISSTGGLARRARAKAAKYNRQAEDAQNAMNRLIEEGDELERRLENSGR